MEKELKAAALRYKADDNAPVLLAFGKDELAKKIINIARQENIPISEQEDEILNIFESIIPGQEIPIELYEVAARILGYIYWIKNNKL
jgi:type III secretion system FlhB-like substrate exporter